MKNLKQHLLDYCKSQGKKLVDIKKELLGLSLSLYDLEDEREYNWEDQKHKDLYEFHQKMVQETIDFINSHPDIQKMISTKREEISEKILEESGYKYTPDLRVYFDVSGLENSIEYGEWTPSTDSSLGIYLGDVNIIFSA